MTGAQVLVAVVLMTGIARADRSAEELVGAAKEALHAMSYTETVQLVEQAWRRGESRPADLRKMFELAGRAGASQENDALAVLWFRRWLAVEPDAELDPGTSPKLTGYLDKARAAGAKLAARVTRQRDRVDVAIESDTVQLAHAARAGAAITALVRGAATLTAPAGSVELLDIYGNVLAVVTPLELAPDVKPALGPWYARWSTWAIASGGLAVLGGGATWIAYDAHARFDDLDKDADVSEAQRLEKRLDRAQWTARIAFGGAAVAAIVGTVLYIRARDKARLDISPTSGGAQATWTVTF